MAKISDNLIINEINGNTCNITYYGREYNNCSINTYVDCVFIGLPEHWMCGEFIAKDEEGPMINIEYWNKYFK